MRHNKRVHGIVAMDKNNLIGENGDLPWPRIREDMKKFQDITIPHPVVMGRNTWNSLPGRFRPLRDRQNIIVSQNPNKLQTDGLSSSVRVVPTIDEAIRLANDDVVYIIGGAGIYTEALTYMDTLYVTHVHGKYTGDVYFPLWDPSEWVCIESIRQTASTLTGATIQVDFARYDRK